MQFFRNLSLAAVFAASAAFLPSCRADRAVARTYKTVDCSLKGYWIRNLCEDEKQYLDRAASSYPEYPDLRSLTAESLQKITRETKDVDIAAALFYHRAVSEKKNQEFYSYISRKEAEFEKKPPDFSEKKALFLMVPGMFYRDNSDVESSGQALRKLAASAGMKEGLIEVEQTGTVDRNGEIICRYLQGFDSSEADGIILVSASKGSGDIKRAAAFCGKEPYFRKVKGWFNIGGIVKGSLLINGIQDGFRSKMEARTYFFVKGYSWKGLLSMRAGEGAPLEKPAVIPEHLLIVNVVGVPLFRHVTQRARPYYEYLIRFGPSDGMVLLADSYMEGAVLYPSFRNDHYFQWPIPENRILAMISYILEKKF